MEVLIGVLPVGLNIPNESCQRKIRLRTRRHPK